MIYNETAQKIKHDVLERTIAAREEKHVLKAEKV